MFESKYYKNKYVYPLEDSNYYAMIETNMRRRECYIFVPDPQIPGDYAGFLREFDKDPLDIEKLIPLKEFLSDTGYTDTDFKNPIGRTKKIVNAIDKINSIEKVKVKK